MPCIVAGAVAAVVAVAGTLLGSSAGASLTYVFQQRAAREQRAEAFGQPLRAERLAAYGGLVTALNEFRRAQLDWLNRRHQDPEEAAAAEARAESYRLRGGAFTALTQVRLVAADPALVAAAAAAYDATEPLSDAEGESELHARIAAANAAAGAFVTMAAADVQAPVAAAGARAAAGC